MCQANSLLFNEYVQYIHAPSLDSIQADFLFVGSDVSYSEITNPNGSFEVSFEIETEKKSAEILKLQNLAFENKKVDCLVFSGENAFLYKACFVVFEKTNFNQKIKIFGKKVHRITYNL